MLDRLIKIPWRGLPQWLIGNRLHILMYHSISANPADPHAVSPARFLTQMQFLQSKRVLPLTDALILLGANETLRDCFVITFDDGLLDFYTTALPILKDFGYPVTMFLPTELVGKTAIWDSFDKTKRLMDWDHIVECQKWKVTFGSHTAHHSRLTELAKDEVQQELTLSLQSLKANCSNFIPALAYPGGYYNESTASYVQQAGYLCALGAASHWGNGPETNLFHLRRERLSI